MTYTLRNLIVTASIGLSMTVFTACSQAAVQPATSADVPVATETPVMSIVDRADALFQTYVLPVDAQGVARFNYAGLASNAADQQVLRDYIAYLGEQNPSTFGTDAQRISYWANLYNAVTIDLILQNYPLKSIRKAKTYNGDKVGGLLGPWKKVKTKANNQTVILDDIEHKILRVEYPSPLIHYMVNCASIGCPNLKDGLWTFQTLDADRDAAARAFINSPRGVRITDKGLIVSEIYNWFKDDFGGNKENVLKHIRQYAGPELAQAIDAGAKIRGYDYNWDLNE